MNGLEKERYENAINAMSQEDIKGLLYCVDMDILWDVLREREIANRNLVQGMKELVK